jgi:RNA polymerase sigma factor (sigma-70 family)
MGGLQVEERFMTGWSGGFGDNLTVEEVMQREEQLRTFYRASTHHVSKYLAPSDERFDDLVQEGVIKAWAEVQTKERELRDSTTFGAVVARRQISSVLVGKVPMTGNEAEQKPRRGTEGRNRKTGVGKTYEPYRRPGSLVRTESVVVNMPSRGDMYAIVDHRIDVQRALGDLSRRDKAIIAGVKADKTWEAIAASLGATVPSVRGRWKRHLQPRLARAFDVTSGDAAA